MSWFRATFPPPLFSTQYVFRPLPLYLQFWRLTFLFYAIIFSLLLVAVFVVGLPLSVVPPSRSLRLSLIMKSLPQLRVLNNHFYFFFLLPLLHSNEPHSFELWRIITNYDIGVSAARAVRLLLFIFLRRISVFPFQLLSIYYNIPIYF